MENEDAGEDGGIPALPAAMADLFLALVGIVVILLIALSPAARLNDVLPEQARQPLPADFTPENTLVLVAGGNDVRVAGAGGSSHPLDRLMEGDLSATLRAASAAGRHIMLLVERDGQEAAFLFEALAHGSGIASIVQARLLQPCDTIADPALMSLCGDSQGGQQ